MEAVKQGSAVVACRVCAQILIRVSLLYSRRMKI